MKSRAKVWSFTIVPTQVSSNGQPPICERISNIGDIKRPRLNGCMSYLGEDTFPESFSFIGMEGIGVYNMPQGKVGYHNGRVGEIG